MNWSFHSVFVGNVLLVKNIERSRLPCSLRDVLVKQYVADESDRQMMSIAGQPVSCHTGFCLLLSSSLPLHLRGIDTSAVSSWHQFLYGCSFQYQKLVWEQIWQHIYMMYVPANQPQFPGASFQHWFLDCVVDFRQDNIGDDVPFIKQTFWIDTHINR